MWPILQKALQTKNEIKSELLSCRACFGSSRLYNMHQHGLAETYRQLVGVEVREKSPLPVHLCQWCLCVLLKCAAFRERCRRAEVLLQNLAVLNTAITAEDISRIDRHTQRLLPPYTQSETCIISCTNVNHTICDGTIDIKSDVKFVDDTITLDDECINVINVDIIKAGNFDKKNIKLEEKSVNKRIRKRIPKKSNIQINSRKRTPSAVKKRKVEVSKQKRKTAGKSTKPLKCNIDKQSHVPTQPHPEHSNSEHIKVEISSQSTNVHKDTSATVDGYNKTDTCTLSTDCNKSEVESVNKDYSSDEESLSEQAKRKENEFNSEFESDLNKLDIEEIVLSKEEQVAEIQARKDTFNYKNSTYKCDKCFKGYICDDSYKSHMVRHEPSSGSHVCDVCRVRCPSEATLRAHAAAHQRKYVCKICGVALRKLFKAKEHARWHKGFRFNCKICGESFPRRVMYLKHKRSQHPTEHVCQECGNAYNTRSGLKLHRKKAHVLKSKGEHACQECGVQFNNEQALKWHAGLAAPPASCDTSLRPCADCGEGFDSEQLLRDHKDTVHRNGAVKCHNCNKSFATKSTLAIHQHRVHLGVRLYPEYPRRGAGGGGGAAAGAGAGAGGRPGLFVCEMCGKTCPSKQSLEIHRRTHTGERPYRCARCDKAFKQRAALNVHQMVHTGAKPYMCPQCGKSFTQSGSMKFHVKTVHLKIPAPYRDRRKKTNYTPMSKE